MRTANPSRIRFSIAILTAVILAAFGISLQAQDAMPIAVGGVQITGQPEDWTHHYLVFSNPGTEDEAIRNGTHDEWLRIVNDPRYVMHQLRRRQPAQGPASEQVAMRLAYAREIEAASAPEIEAAPVRKIAAVPAREIDPPRAIPVEPWSGRPARPVPPRRARTVLKADWTQGMLTGAVTPNAYPAKYSFAPIGTPNCASDYVVYPTGSVGSATKATIIAYNNLYATTCSTGTVPSVYWAYNTGAAAVTTSPVLSLDGTKVAFIQTTGLSAVLVVLKFASSTTQTVSNPGTPTTSTNITTCTAPCMSVTNITLLTSDTYSSPYYDYTNDVIYVGDDASHLYKITGVFKGTTSPSVSQITLNLITVVPIYSPVYGATSGCVFVGGGGGFIYSVSSGFPGTVCTGSTYALFGRTEQLGNGSGNGMNDAPLVDPAAGTFYAFITASLNLIGTFGGSGTCASGQNCVLEFGTSTISSGSTTAEPINAQGVGNGGQGYNLYAGTFDNIYYSSISPSSPSGNIYVVGNTSNSGAGTLYRVPIVSNALQTSVTIGIVNVTKNAWPSPVTEFCNNGASACVSNGLATISGTDRIFFSVFEGNVAGSNCMNQGAGLGCVFSYNVNTPLAANSNPVPSGSLTIPYPSGNGCWGTAGIIIDNASASTGASQVYFVKFNGNSPSGAPSACTIVTTSIIQAAQASQAALQ